MREIKFRAWNNQCKCWASGDFWSNRVHIEYNWLSPSTMKKWHEDYDIVQYTGLKDKNGKEIYEGDIVLYDRNINDRVDKYKFKVEWLEGYYYLEGIKNMVWIDYDIDWELTEVIGNIYENQELI